MIRNFPKRLTRLQKRLMLGKRPMLGQGNRRARSRRLGAATIEMAFIAPVIFAIVFGSVEFARVMMVRQSLTNAAREGCRHACLVATRKDSESEQVVRSALQGVLNNPSNEKLLRVSFSPEFVEALPTGTTITTTVEIDCEDVTWLPPFFCADSRIRTISSMIRE